MNLKLKDYKEEELNKIEQKHINLREILIKFNCLRDNIISVLNGVIKMKITKSVCETKRYRFWKCENKRYRFWKVGNMQNEYRFVLQLGNTLIWFMKRGKI